MAKADKSGQLALRGLQEILLVAALPRIAHVLRPFPKDVKSDELNAAVETLRKKGLVHGSAREPNLTRAGVEAARAIAKQD